MEKRKYYAYKINLMTNKRLYIDLDKFINLHNLPDFKEPIAKSYNLIKQNTWQRTIDLYGDDARNTWLLKDGKDYFQNPSNIFMYEVLNNVLSPMWILNLTKHDTEINLYDSISTSPEAWDKIKFRDDLDQSWNKVLKWIDHLDIFIKKGRVSIIITRPGIPIQYHRDTGKPFSSYKPYKHRQEFIWINLTPIRNFYILDENNNPHKVTSKSAFFNHHFWHGSHEAPQRWCFSIKIEGIFTSVLRQKINLNQQYYIGRI